VDDELIDQLTERTARPKPAGRSVHNSRRRGKLARLPSRKQDRPMGNRTAAQRQLVATRNIEPRAYQPLDSVWYDEEDAQLLERLLAFYPHREPRLILDATVNGGRFWRGSARRVVGLDIDPSHRPQVCADNAAMPFASGSFDAVVYDPPHVPNQGRDRAKDFNKRFGLGARSSKENGYAFTHTFPAFMAEAWRVLAEGGVLLCKIADYVHNHRYQWAHIDIVRAGQDVGFTACDCIVKVRKGPIVDPKWKTAHHTRRRHCYWIVFRKSPRCE
jgi:SAM-dependent methyltransferase